MNNKRVKLGEVMMDVVFFSGLIILAVVMAGLFVLIVTY